MALFDRRSVLSCVHVFHPLCQVNDSIFNQIEFDALKLKRPEHSHSRLFVPAQCHNHGDRVALHILHREQAFAGCLVGLDHRRSGVHQLVVKSHPTKPDPQSRQELPAVYSVAVRQPVRQAAARCTGPRPNAERGAASDRSDHKVG